MAPATGFSCLLIGGTSFLIQCANRLLNKGHTVTAIVSGDRAVLRWCEENGISNIPSLHTLAQDTQRPDFDYLFSLANFDILPAHILALPSRYAINYHDGPLPRYAGVNSPTWAIMAGESMHGVTWHKMTGEIDAGDILKQALFPIDPDENSLSLNAKCYEAGLASFAELIDELAENRVVPQPQTRDPATWCPPSRRPPAAAVLDWHRRAEELDALCRALDFGSQPNHIAAPKIYLGSRYALVKSLRVLSERSGNPPGTLVHLTETQARITTVSGDVLITRLFDLDGTPVTVGALFEQAGLSSGDTLPHRKKPELDMLEATDRDMSRHETFWEARLQEMELIEIPYAAQSARAAGHSSIRSRKLQRLDASWANRSPAGRQPGDILLGSLLLYLGRLAQRSTFDVGLRPLSLDARTAGAAQLASPWVTLRVDVDFNAPCSQAWDILADQIAQAARRGSFSRDLVARLPAMGKTHRDSHLMTPDIVIEHVDSLDEFRPHTGAALTIAVPRDAAAVLWTYDAAVYGDPAIETLCRQFHLFLTEALSHEQKPVFALPLLSLEESWKLFVEWNATETDFSRDLTVPQLIEAQATRTPDATALAFRDETITYRDLDRRANQLAHYLMRHRVGPDTLVGVMLDRSIDLVVALLGVMKAGGAYVPLDPAYPPARLQFMVADSGLPLIVTELRYRELASDMSVASVVLDAEREAIARESSDAPDISMFPTSLAYVIYTSGSTGQPKGVMIEHQNVVNFFTGMDQRISHDKPGVWLSVTSISFDISVLELFWTLTHGFTVVIHADDLRAEQTPRPTLRNPRKNIDFSLFYWNLAREDEDDAPDKYRLLIESAKFADEHGFAALWTPERHFHGFGGLFPNPSVVSAALALITRNVQLRAGSCVVPLHSPIRIAEEWSVVDNLSNGRVGLAAAAGWNPNDFAILPANYAAAKTIMEETIGTLRRLWRGETLKFPGPNGEVDVRTLPRPIQRELPLWVTAASNPETFALAARLGAGVLTHLLGQTVEKVGENIQLYRKTWRESGHAGEGHVTLMLHTLVAEDDDKVRDIVREPMKTYLRSAANLVKAAAWHFPTFKEKSAETGKTLDDFFNNISEADWDDLLEFSFQRYFNASGLLGKSGRCLATIDKLKDIGVDEIGCLIDFGVATDEVLAHLPALDALRRAANEAASTASIETYTIPSLISRYGVTHFQCTPSMVRMLLNDPESRAALSSLQHIFVGGEALPSRLAADLRACFSGNLTNMYGPTEATVWCSTHAIHDAQGPIPIGRPIANTRFYILDERLQPVPIGIPGELYVGGAGIARGYLNRPELTAERFVRSPYSANTDERLYRTGDLVRCRPDGNIEFIGRVDHQVKIRGYRIELGEIEHALQQHSDIQHAVVTVLEDDAGDKRIVAYLVPARGKSPVARDLRVYLKDRLAEYMVPSMYVLLDRLPLTPNGKVDRKALPTPEAVSAAPDNDYVAPRSAVEQALASHWQSLLNTRRVGANDNFFDLGGDSLLAIQVLCHITEAFGTQLPLYTVFQSPRLAELAQIIERRMEEIAVPHIGRESELAQFEHID